MALVKRGVVALGMLLILGMIYQQWAERRDMARYPAPGRLVSTGHHRLHIRCVGHGSPTVLLLSGDGTPSVTMYAAQNKIAAFTTVCSYDRAGLGWSDPATAPMGLVQQVDDLAQLVRRAKVSTPVVLVPESGGNVIALSFFQRWPSAVAGMVMVDGSEPELWFRGSPDEFPMLRATDPLYQIAWHVGVIRLLLPFMLPSWVDTLSPTVRGQFDAIWSRPMPGYARDTLDRWEQTRVAERPMVIAGAMGDRPLIIIRHGKPGGMGVPAQYEREWPRAQAVLATLSSDSTIVTATSNHHPIAEENPRLVSEQVGALVRKLRSRPHHVG